MGCTNCKCRKTCEELIYYLTDDSYPDLRGCFELYYIGEAREVPDDCPLRVLLK